MSRPDKDKRPSAGRIRHEPGGKAVWEWAIESGRVALDSTSRLLQKLEITGMRVLGDDEKDWEKRGTEPPPLDREKSAPTQTPGLSLEKEQDPLAHERKSFNPYDTRTPAVRAPARPAIASRPRLTQPPRPAPKPGLLSRMFRRNKP